MDYGACASEMMVLWEAGCTKPVGRNRWTKLLDETALRSPLRSDRFVFGQLAEFADDHVTLQAR